MLVTLRSRNTRADVVPINATSRSGVVPGLQRRSTLALAIGFIASACFVGNASAGKSVV